MSSVENKAAKQKFLQLEGQRQKSKERTTMRNKIGWLVKESRRNKWKRRFFELLFFEKQLRWYHNQNRSVKPIRTVNLTEEVRWIRQEFLAKTPSAPAFSVCVSFRVYVLIAEDEAQRRSWMHLIATSGNVRIMVPSSQSYPSKEWEAENPGLLPPISRRASKLGRRITCMLSSSTPSIPNTQKRNDKRASSAHTVTLDHNVVPYSKESSFKFLERSTSDRPHVTSNVSKEKKHQSERKSTKKTHKEKEETKKVIEKPETEAQTIISDDEATLDLHLQAKLVDETNLERYFQSTSPDFDVLNSPKQVEETQVEKQKDAEHEYTYEYEFEEVSDDEEIEYQDFFYEVEEELKSPADIDRLAKKYEELQGKRFSEQVSQSTESYVPNVTNERHIQTVSQKKVHSALCKSLVRSLQLKKIVEELNQESATSPKEASSTSPTENLEL